MDSMFRQTLPTDDFVLVCDGPLTEDLDAVITSYSRQYPAILRVLRLPSHQGLAAALNAGLQSCRHDLIARMDSDDISLPHRCAMQFGCFTSTPSELSILSGTILEFDSTPAISTGRRTVPSGHQAICRYSKKRSPFNHPAVMYRKSAVTAVGGYREDFSCLEDYDLWIRMLQNGFRGENLREPILFMRTGAGLYRRRSGRNYARQLLSFHRRLQSCGWINTLDFLSGSIPHALACLLPVPLLRQAYRHLHR